MSVLPFENILQYLDNVSSYFFANNPKKYEKLLELWSCYLDNKISFENIFEYITFLLGEELLLANQFNQLLLPSFKLCSHLLDDDKNIFKVEDNCKTSFNEEDNNRNDIINFSKFGPWDELALFDQIRWTLGNDQSYANLLRCVRLFNNHLISGAKLWNLIDQFIRNPTLKLKLKIMLFKNMGSDFTDSQVKSSNMDSMMSGGKMEKTRVAYEIDFTSSRKSCSSYRLLDVNYNKPECLRRNNPYEEVLNDRWISFPVWSEDPASTTTSESSGSGKINSVQEFFFRLEEERFEMDNAIDSLKSTLFFLKDVNDKMKENKDREFRLDDKLGGNSDILQIKVIERIYGDESNQVMQLLKQNPYKTIPVVIKRLEMKIDAWIDEQMKFNKIWKEQTDKHFLRSLNCEMNLLKQSEVKTNKFKVIFNEAESIKEECEMLEKLYGSRTSNIYNISNSKCSNVINKNISFERKLCSDDQTLFQNTDNNHTVFDNYQCNTVDSMLGITLSYHNRKVFKDVNRLLFSAFPLQQPQHTPLVNAKEQYDNKKCRHVLHLLAALLNFASVDEMDDDSYFNNITNHNNYYDIKSSCVMSKNKSLKLDHICDTNTTEKNDYLKKINSNNYHITKNSRNYFNDNGHSTSLTLAEVELNTSRYNYYTATAGITSATSDTGTSITARDDDDGDKNCYFNAFNGMTLEHENCHNNYDFYEYCQSKNTNENINRDKIGISDEDDKDSDCFVKRQFNFDDFSDMDGISNDNNVYKNFIVFENISKQTPSATNVIDKGDDNFECLCDNIYDIEMLKLNNSNKFMMYLTEKWYVFLHLHHKLFKRLVDILKLSVIDYSQDDCKIDYDSNRNEAFKAKGNDEQMRLRSRNFTKAATVTDTTALIDNTITTFATANITSDTNQINGNMNFYNFALDICQQYIHNGTTCEDLIKTAMDSFNNRDNDQNIKLNKVFPLIVTLDKLIDVVVKEIQSLVLDELSCKSINLFKKCIIHSSSTFSSTFSLSSCLKRNDSYNQLLSTTMSTTKSIKPSPSIEIQQLPDYIDSHNNFMYKKEKNSHMESYKHQAIKLLTDNNLCQIDVSRQNSCIKMQMLNGKIQASDEMVLEVIEHQKNETYKEVQFINDVWNRNVMHLISIPFLIRNIKKQKIIDLSNLIYVGEEHGYFLRKTYKLMFLSNSRSFLFKRCVMPLTKQRMIRKTRERSKKFFNLLKTWSPQIIPINFDFPTPCKRL